ncbi:glycosyl hydrolase family 8 [Novosphingobium sp.]|uniref:glycosyl hydrolase family 8 n=1 Tax=Novosphingobium sp. TaxID=1874826 RepID=UPI0035640E6B
MAVNRRNFGLGLVSILTVACAKVPESKAKAGDSFWALFRERFILPSGRVIDNGNGNISHSEGQGYGLLLAVINGDEATFEALAGWTEDTLGRADVALHSWRYDPRQPDPVADPNNATDGDMLIAWALSLGAKKWRNRSYAARSKAIRQAIRARLIVQRNGEQLLLPGMVGFVEAERVVINPSYYIWPALDHFRAVDGAPAWASVINDGMRIMSRARFGEHGLPADWLQVDPTGTWAPATDKPARFGFDAIRIPLYAEAGRRKVLSEPVVAWWQSLASSGQQIPAWIDLQSGQVAPYGLSAGGNAIMALALGRPQPDVLAGDYYAAVLQLFARYVK